MFWFKCVFKTTKDKLYIKHEHFFRVVCVGCVATMTRSQTMTSPRGAMLWWWTPWCSGTAGRIHQTAPTSSARTAPAQPTPTDRRGPRNSAASYRAPPSLPATPLYVVVEGETMLFLIYARSIRECLQGQGDIKPSDMFSVSVTWCYAVQKDLSPFTSMGKETSVTPWVIFWASKLLWNDSFNHQDLIHQVW